MPVKWTFRAEHGSATLMPACTKLKQKGLKFQASVSNKVRFSKQQAETNKISI